MYPDLITPKSYPEKLQELSYDPFGLMPAALPPRPRVLATAAEIARAKERIARVPWAKAAMALLLDHCAQVDEIPDALPVPANGKLNNSALYYAQRLALAFLLTGEESYRERAIATFRKLAVAYPQWTISRGGGRATGNSLGESHYTHHFGRTYDLLAACGLDDADDAAFREALMLAYDVSDHPTHPTCGNHNTWRLCGRLAVASALGDLQGIHHALYGFERDGTWRYGLIHQLRHDILPDGLHWERTPGYHYYTLMGLTEIADMLMHLGIDIWHAELPMQRQNDGHDIHRVYGPRGVKSLKVAYDAPFYLAFPNGDLSVLSDSGLVNLRGTHIWGPVYDLAYEAYGDEKYAWLLHKVERESPERAHPELPMSLQTVMGDLDFVRIAHESYLEGHFTHAEDCRFAPLARHEQGCSLFPAFGGGVLRGDPADRAAPSAYLFWGPHNAGHQSPAALHLDLHAAGEVITSAPKTHGYGDPNYLTWPRTTIAHNTVTVDEQPMFPYDFPTESIWECDHWRDTVSDGVLELFQPDAGFSALRASNEEVYPGVRLDRTVIVTTGYVIDAYRVLSAEEHRYDWAMHVIGDLLQPDAAPVALGGNRGYNHLAENQALEPLPAAIRYAHKDMPVALHLAEPQGAQLVLTRDPVDSDGDNLGGQAKNDPHTGIIARAHGRNVLFLALWQFQPGDKPLGITVCEGGADTDLTLEVQSGDETTAWRLPFAPAPVAMRQRQPVK